MTQVTISLYNHEYQDIFKIYYHYMHYLPNESVAMLVPKDLLDITLETLKKNPLVLIDQVKNMED